jgi:hypothetical protein
MDDTAARLGCAIESGDFDKAEPLVLDYRNRVQAQLRAASTTTERRDIAAQALEILHLHLRLARTIRSHITARLQTIAGQSSYQQLAVERRTWCIDA